MNHIMVDIETLATTQDAVVLSIGAVAFDPNSKELGEKFYVEFTDDMTTQQRLGRRIDADTVRWWMQQSDEAKKIFATAEQSPDRRMDRATTASGLSLFNDFVEHNGGKKMQLWGNGADFDNVIIGSLYDTFNMTKPWSYGRNRCYRTIKRMFGEDVPLVRQGVHHNGLDDAITQAVHLQEILACVKSR